MPKPNEYRALMCYGITQNHREDRVKQLQARAAEDNAPVDALYFSPTYHKWVCLSDLDPSMPVVDKVNKLLESFS